MMKWFMGGLGTLIIGKTVFDFILMMKVAVFEAYFDKMRRNIALIKGKVLGVPISVEVLGVLLLAEAPVFKEKETKK
ncbi:hypothetical protein TWF730_002544 [Orbilia blumenaviensis]|uniref:Uncharacterized protein n=1 Tax=Orbilia blumenaviensis TaxID=1796055 RepID=A0AAV9UDX0_9PEZI